MSYDLEVWSVHPIGPAAFRDPEKWEHPDDTQWVRSGSSWQMVISSSSKLLPEDVPAEIAQLLPGIKYLTSIGLEGRRTNEAMQLVKSTSTHLAKSLHGIILDKQEDTTVTPAGVKRFVPPPKHEETFSVLRFSWWFLESPLLSAAGRENFLALLERHLPEALPRRYGLYEPPQHIYAETGKVHLLQFMEENLHGFTVWYPNRPVVSLYLGHPDPVGASKLGFRTNHIEIEVESTVVAQPGWTDNLYQFWNQVSRFLMPLYGEVRTLGGRQRRGGTLYASFKAEAGLELTKSWWWRGVPKKLGSAVVLGEAYQELWPAFVSKASIQERLAFASTADWADSRDLSEDLGAPPRSISTRREADRPANQEYPSDWPFGEPFDPPRPPLNKSLMRKLRDLFPAFVLIILLFSIPVSLGKENAARSLNLCALCVPISANSVLSPSFPAQTRNEKPDWCTNHSRPEYKNLRGGRVENFTENF